MVVLTDIFAQIDEAQHMLHRTTQASSERSYASARKRPLYDDGPMYSSSETLAEVEVDRRYDPKLNWVERTIPASMDLAAYRATASNNLRTPVLNMKGISELSAVVEADQTARNRLRAAQRRASKQGGFTSVRVDAGASNFNLFRNDNYKMMMTDTVDTNAGVDAPSNLNLLHILGVPNSRDFAGKSPLELNEMMQSLDLSVAFPYNLTERPRVSRYATQRFIRRLSESDKYLLSVVSPLRVVRHVPDEYQVAMIWYHDVYAPKLAYWADRQQGTWTRSESRFPSQMRGLRTEMELHAMLEKDGPLQWAMQHEQMYTGVERTLCMLVKNQLINYAVRRTMGPWQPSADPDEDTFISDARKAMRFAGGCQKADVGISKLLNELRTRFDVKEIDAASVVFGGVREMIAVENNNPLHAFSFLTGLPSLKVGADDRGRNPNIWSNVPMFYLNDELTPDGADAINTITTRTRWGEFAVIPGSSDKNEFQLPGKIRVTNERTDQHTTITFKKAFDSAFGSTEADFEFDKDSREQFYRHLRRMPQLAEATPEHLRSPGRVLHLLGLLDKVAKSFATVGAAANLRDAQKASLPRADHDGGYPDDCDAIIAKITQERQAMAKGLLHESVTWPEYMKTCSMFSVAPEFDLCLLWTVSAITSMLIGIVPGAQTMSTVIGEINSALAFNGVTKSITDNLDFRCAVPVRQPNNIDAIPAAYVHRLVAPESSTGEDFVNDKDIDEGPEAIRKKMFFVVPIFHTGDLKEHTETPALVAGSSRPVISITGHYPGVMEDKENAQGHFRGGPVVLQAADLKLQGNRFMGALDNYCDIKFELPRLFYRSQHGVYKKTGDEAKDIEWQCGEGLRGDYTGPNYRQAWSNKCVLQKASYMPSTNVGSGLSVSLKY